MDLVDLTPRVALLVAAQCVGINRQADFTLLVEGQVYNLNVAEFNPFVVNHRASFKPIPIG
jgi:hypothetical protein